MKTRGSGSIHFVHALTAGCDGRGSEVGFGIARRLEPCSPAANMTSASGAANMVGIAVGYGTATEVRDASIRRTRQQVRGSP